MFIVKKKSPYRINHKGNIVRQYNFILFGHVRRHRGKGLVRDDFHQFICVLADIIWRERTETGRHLRLIKSTHTVSLSFKNCSSVATGLRFGCFLWTRSL